MKNIDNLLNNNIHFFTNLNNNINIFHNLDNHINNIIDFLNNNIQIIIFSTIFLNLFFLRIFIIYNFIIYYENSQENKFKKKMHKNLLNTFTPVPDNDNPDDDNPDDDDELKKKNYNKKKYISRVIRILLTSIMLCYSWYFWYPGDTLTIFLDRNYLKMVIFIGLFCEASDLDNFEDFEDSLPSNNEDNEDSLPSNNEDNEDSLPSNNEDNEDSLLSNNKALLKEKKNNL